MDMLVRNFKVRSFEKGLYFRNGEFVGVLGTGSHWFLDPLRKVRVDVVSQRAPWLIHSELDLIVKSGALDGKVLVLDLKDTERALVWVDERFERVLGPGLHVAWTKFRNVRAEVIDASGGRFEHKSMNTILNVKSAMPYLEVYNVPDGHQGVLLRDAELLGCFNPGRYVFWKNTGSVSAQLVNLKETVMDVAGQELMTADKVTLRLNAVVTFRVADAVKAVMTVDNWSAALYKDAQLALRAVVGGRDLDALLGEKDSVAAELEQMLKPRAAELGVQVLSLGIKDVILPGDMKELMNRVIEARKAAQANLIARQEETAAMRSQANTARLLENNPTLMRLRELEVLEKVAANNKLNVVLGEKRLTDRIVNLI